VLLRDAKHSHKRDTPPHSVFNAPTAALADLWPSKIESARLDAVQAQGAAEAPTVLRLRVTFRSPILAYLLLGLACWSFGGGAALQKQIAAGTDMLKMSWRSQLTALYLLPLTVWCLLRDRQARAAFIMWRAQLRIILGGICMSVWMMIFYMSLEHTSILHACLFSNVHSVVIVIANLVCCRPTACGELLGVLLSIAGGVVMLSGPPAGNVNVGWDMACIGAAMFGTVYLVSTENLRVNIPLVLFMPEMMTVAAIASGAYSVLHEGSEVWLSDHAETVFGWVLLGREQLIKVTLGAFLSGIVGGLGYAAVLKYLPAVVVAIVLLLEPITGDVVGLLLKVEDVPDVHTIVGSGVLMLASCVIIVTDYLKSRTVDADLATLVKPLDAPSEFAKTDSFAV